MRPPSVRGNPSPPVGPSSGRPLTPSSESAPRPPDRTTVHNERHPRIKSALRKTRSDHRLASGVRGVVEVICSCRASERGRAGPQCKRRANRNNAPGTNEIARFDDRRLHAIRSAMTTSRRNLRGLASSGSAISVAAGHGRAELVHDRMARARRPQALLRARKSLNDLEARVPRVSPRPPPHPKSSSRC